MKRILYTLLLLNFFSSFISCDDYDGETKYVYEGRILDASGNPLQGIPVNVKVNMSDFIFSFPYSVNETDIISYTTTDQSGYYKMVFPKPQETAGISLQVNYDSPSTTANTNFSSTVIYNILEENNSDYKISFNDTRLYNTNTSVPLTIQFNPQNGNELTKANINGLVEENYIDYNLNMPVIDTNQWINTFNNIFMVAPNQLLTIQYQLQDQSGNITVHEAQVQVNDQAVTFQLTY